MPPIPSKPRLALYDPSPSPSGPSRYVESLLTALDPAEFDITLFCRHAGPYAARPHVHLVLIDSAATDSAPPTLPKKSRAWRTLAPAPLKLWAGFARDARRLAAAFRRRPVDLLHTNSVGCEESAVAARLAGVPRVLGTFHVDSTYDLAHRRSHARHRLLECVSNHSLHAAIAVSHATRRDWLRRTRLPADRVTTIHNGIRPLASPLSRHEARHRLNLPQNCLLIGGVGRLEPAKNFHDLLTAAAALAREFPTLTVALAGRGPLHGDLADHAARLGIADRVHFLGFQSDVAPVYAALDVFVLPSLCEALPYALLEAMRAGLPAVATAVGGVPEVILEGETGFLAPPRNPAALATALRPLLRNPHLRHRLGQAAQTRVATHFTESQMVAQTLTLYRHLLAA